MDIVYRQGISLKHEDCRAARTFHYKTGEKDRKQYGGKPKSPAVPNSVDEILTAALPDHFGAIATANTFFSVPAVGGMPALQFELLDRALHPHSMLVHAGGSGGQARMNQQIVPYVEQRL